jgi:hypothetical protein
MAFSFLSILERAFQVGEVGAKSFIYVLQQNGTIEKCHYGSD